MSWLALSVLFAPAVVRAAPEPFEYYASVDRDRVAIDETLTLTVTVTTGGKEPESFELPRHPDFELLSQSRSDQMSVSIGSGGSGIRKTRTYTLVLRPTRQGEFTILPGVAVANGKRVETGRLLVRVGAPGTGAPRAAAPQRPSWPSPFGNLPGFDDDFDPFGALRQDRTPPSDSDVVLKAVTDVAEVHVGQQVTLTLYLMARTDVSGIESLQMPKLNGFWSEDIEAPTQISGETRTIDGVPWRFYLLRKRALFPLREGELSIDPAEVDVLVGSGPFTRRVKMHRKSAAVTVQVKALPPGAPAGFVPSSVGRWSLDVEAEPRAVAPGSPVTLRVRALGQGNLGSLELPRLPAIDGVKTFDPTQTDDLDIRKGRYGGSRTQEYVLVPSRSGSFTIPSLELSYFDPATERYEVARTEPLHVRVLPGGVADSKGPASAPPPPSGREEDEGGLAPLRTATSIDAEREPWFARPWFPFAVAVPPLALFALLLGPRLGRRSSGGRSREGAGDAARRRLAAARALAERKDPRFHDELDRAMHAAVEDVLGRRAGGLSRERLATALMEAGVAPQAVEDACAVLEHCDAGRFAPGALDADSARATLERADRALAGLQEGKRR